MAISPDVILKIMVQTGASEEEINRFKKKMEDLGHVFEKTGKQAEEVGKQSEEAGKKIEETGKKTSKATKESEGLFGVLNQIRIGLTQLARGDIGGLPNLITAFRRFKELTAEAQGKIIAMARVFAGVGVAAGVIAATIYGIVKATQAMIDVAEQVGTRSRKDFEKLDETFKAIGVQITQMDRALSQELLRSLDQVKAAFDSIFLVMLREAGPALILFFRQLTLVLKDLQPVAAALGVSLRGFFTDLAALIASFRDLEKGVVDELLKTGKFSFATAVFKIFEHNLKDARAKAEAIDLPGAVFDDKKKKAKKLKDESIEAFKETQADLRRLAKADLEASLQRIESEREVVLRAARQGLISVADAEERLLSLKEQQIAALETEYDTRLQLSDVLETQARIEAARIERNTAFAKFSADALKTETANWKSIVEGRLTYLSTLTEEIRLLRERKDLLVIPEPPPILRGEGGAAFPGGPQKIVETKNAFDLIGAALKNSGVAFTTWGDFAARAIQGVASATQDLLANFILTGQGGARAFKSLAAGIIASLAVEAGVRAIMELAAGFSNLAKASAAAANPFTAWQVPFFAAAAKANFASAKMYGAISAGAAVAGVAIGAAGGLEGGGGGGGGAGAGAGTLAPAPVTINQGSAAGFLGVRPDVVLQADLMNRQVAALETFNAKFNATTPGNVLVAGAGERPDAVAGAALEQSRRDSSFGREMLSNWGVG